MWGEICWESFHQGEKFMGNSSGTNFIAIGVALIALCGAAMVCFVPIVARLVDIYLPIPTVTPATVLPQPVQSPQPIPGDSCPPTPGAGYALSDGDFKGGMVITGPAALHPRKGSDKLGEALGIDSVSRWGINIPAGRSVTIPTSIMLEDGSSYSPEGFYEIYATDSDVAIVQERWRTHCP